MSTELKENRKQYVTVVEAAHLCNRSERTIRRWIEKKYVRVWRSEQTRSVRVDLDDIQRMQAMKPDTIHPVRDEIERIASNEENQEQRIQKLEQQLAILQEREEVLQKRVDFLMSEPQRIGAGNLLLLPRRSSSESSAESRGLPPGTQRLATFSEQHKVTVGQIKSLYHLRLIELTIYQRPGEAIRNKQEWWISPEQHKQLAHYWQEHQISYTPCDQCQGCIGQMQNSEIG